MPCRSTLHCHFCPAKEQIFKVGEVTYPLIVAGLRVFSVDPVVNERNICKKKAEASSRSRIIIIITMHLSYNSVFVFNFALPIQLFCSTFVFRDAYPWGARGAAAPSSLFRGGQEGQELPFVLHCFHLSCHVKGHFPAL